MFPLIKKNLFFIISLQIFFSFIIIISPNQIIFPFKTEPLNIDSSKYIEAITNNKIYITTEIGEPPQKINLLLTMDSSSLLIANSSIDSSYYNNIKSNTYLNTEKLDNIYFELYTKGYYANDNFIFQISYDNSNKKKFNNIQFIHVIEFSDQKYLYSGYFGLQLPKENKKMHIIENLKQENAISSYIFNLNYTSDNEGYLSIGEYPPELKDDKKKEELKRTKALPCENNADINRNDLCWNLKFNDIKFGDIKVYRERDAKIDPGLGFIRGTSEYLQKIEGNYFGKLQGGKCTQKLSDNHYYYFECEKNTDLSSFKDLIFVHQELMYNFVLTKDDLFKEYDDKLYFLIVFDKFLSLNNYWILGKPFIKKYSFLYDIDSKQIYFNVNDNNINENGGGSNFIVYWVIISVLGLCVIIMISFVLIKIFLKPKKKKANELKEDIDFLNEESNNNNDNDNNKNNLGIS